jgi:hypothetical protein
LVADAIEREHLREALQQAELADAILEIATADAELVHPVAHAAMEERFAAQLLALEGENAELQGVISLLWASSLLGRISSNRRA